MIDWVNGVPPAELAAELMAAFGSAGALSLGDLCFEWLLGSRGYPKPRDYWDRLLTPLGEALQLLEHAELVYIPPDNPSQGRPIKWSATRFGLATMANGKTDVRQRIKDRHGL